MGNDAEKARLLLVTQLMSLQLVYSVKGIAHIHSPSPSTAMESDENQNEERADWLKTLQYSLSSLAYCRPNTEALNTRSPPSSPSGYETASDHSDDEMQSPKRDASEIEYPKDVLNEASSSSNVCSPLLEKLRTPYGPRKSRIIENLIGSNMFGVNVEHFLAPATLSKTVNDLRKELYQLKLHINRDIIQFCNTFFHLEEHAVGKGSFSLFHSYFML